MTQPAAEQLLNLADRAEHHGGLTADEAQRLRDGIGLLAALLRDAEGDRDSWAQDARAAERRYDTACAELHDAQIALQKEEARAERAEAAIERLRALHPEGADGRCEGCGVPWPCLNVCRLTIPPGCRNCEEYHTPATAALDPQEPQP